jgi:hypothetical protein
LLALIKVLTPARHRDNVEETLREAGLSRFQFIIHTPRFVVGSFLGNVWTALNARPHIYPATSSTQEISFVSACLRSTCRRGSSSCFSFDIESSNQG